MESGSFSMWLLIKVESSSSAVPASAILSMKACKSSSFLIISAPFYGVSCRSLWSHYNSGAPCSVVDSTSILRSKFPVMLNRNVLYLPWNSNLICWVGLQMQKPSKASETLRLYRTWLPYGRWDCVDGREILFNRDYKPIWERSANYAVRQANQSEHVDNVKNEQFFYDDGCPPNTNKETVQKCLSILADFGVTDTQIPDEYI